MTDEREDIQQLIDELEIPHDAPAVLARAYAVGQVMSCEHGDQATRIKISIPPHLQREFEQYRVPAP